MSLRIKSLISKIPFFLLWLAILFVVGCLVKVAVWENIYYHEKEGSKRYPAVEVGIGAPDQEEVDETEITSDQITAHNVAPDKPRYLMASFMTKKVTTARIREVGLTPSGAMATLASIFDVAWYNNSSKPGNGGVLLMNGHNGGPNKDGVFKNLDQAKVGDIVSIERGDGVLFHYEVFENKIMTISEANDYMATMQKTHKSGKETLALISCTGEWSQSRRTFLSRAMVRAVLVDSI